MACGSDGRTRTEDSSGMSRRHLASVSICYINCLLEKKKMLTKGTRGGPATDEGDQRDRRLRKGTRGTGDCDGCADEGDRTAGSRY